MDCERGRGEGALHRWLICFKIQALQITMSVGPLRPPPGGDETDAATYGKRNSGRRRNQGRLEFAVPFA